MTVKCAMILAAGLGTRMRPLTLKTPKPLIKVGRKNLLERSLNLLENHGVEQIIINVHHLADQIEKFLLDVKSKVKITISNEKDLLLDTGGGVKEGTKSLLEASKLQKFSSDFDNPLEGIRADEVIVDASAAKGQSQPIIVHSKSDNKVKTSKTSAA